MKTFVLVSFCLLIIIKLYSQDAEKNDGLEVISGKINTYYAQGQKERAEYMQNLIEDAVYFYEGLLQDTFSFDLYVLDNKTRKQFTGEFSPIPYYTKEENRIVMPAKGMLKTYLAPGDSIYGRDWYYFSDFLAVHELGHYISQKQEARSYSGWAGEFFADYINVAYMHEKFPGYKFDESHTSYFTFFPAGHKSLERYGSGGIFEIVYHTKFRELAHQLYLKHGMSFMFKWIEIWKELNKDVNAGKFENMNITKEMIFQKSLENIQSIDTDIFNEWNKSMRQTYHSWLIMLGLMLLIGLIRLTNTSYSIFTTLNLKTKRIHRIFGVPTPRIWYSLNKIKSISIKYKLIRISVLRILNFILVTILILSIALILF